MPLPEIRQVAPARSPSRNRIESLPPVVFSRLDPGGYDLRVVDDQEIAGTNVTDEIAKRAVLDRPIRPGSIP